MDYLAYLFNQILQSAIDFIFADAPVIGICKGVYNDFPDGFNGNFGYFNSGCPAARFDAPVDMILDIGETLSDQVEYVILDSSDIGETDPFIGH